MTKLKTLVAKIKRKLRWKWNDVAAIFGRSFQTNQLNGSLRVVCFHGVCSDDEPYINSRFLHVSKCDALFSAFTEYFSVLSLEDFLAGRLDRERPNLLITFDDGYQNNMSLALPLLEKYGLHATIFCTTQKKLWMDLFDVAKASNISFEPLKLKFTELKEMDATGIHSWAIQQDAPTLSRFQSVLEALVKSELNSKSVFHDLLTDKELRALQDHSLVSIANHGSAHLSYTAQSAEALAVDFAACRQRLELVGSPYWNVFAYPFGHHSDFTREQLTHLGVTHQFIADGNWNAASDCVDRIVINPYISVHNQLIAIRDGGY